MEIIIDSDFFGDKRRYTDNYSFNQEWDFKITASSKEEAIEIIMKSMNLFKKCDEIDFRDSIGHFMCKKIC